MKVIFILVLFSSVWAKAGAPASCKGVDLSKYMVAGHPDNAAPDKIYKFTAIRDGLVRSISSPNGNPGCLSDFYRGALDEEGSYWGTKLAREGCTVSNSGQISGTCPSASEARKSTQFMANLDSELRGSIHDRLEASELLKAEKNGTRPTGTCPARSAANDEIADVHNLMCCGTPSGNVTGVIQAVEGGINYNTCLGKIKPTNQRFFSGGGIAACLGNAISAAAHVIWDSITSIFKLPGELWAARSQIWALITQPSARAQFAAKMMGVLEHFFTDRVEAFKCFNSYEKAQYICKLGGQIVATCALPETMGAFLGLIAKPVAQAAKLLGAIMSKSGKGARILGGLERGTAVAKRAATAVTSRVGKAAEAADAATGRVASRTADALERARKLIGSPISSLAERAALRIERSASYQRLLVSSYRAEKTAAAAEGTALATRAQPIEGEVLPPEHPVGPARAQKLREDDIIEGDFRVVDDGKGPARPDSTQRQLEGPAPERPALATSEERAAIAAPAERPALAAPAERSALPTTATAPDRPLLLTGPPERPLLTGPPERPLLTGPARTNVPAPAAAAAPNRNLPVVQTRPTTVAATNVTAKATVTTNVATTTEVRVATSAPAAGGTSTFSAPVPARIQATTGFSGSATIQRGGTVVETGAGETTSRFSSSVSPTPRGATVARAELAAVTEEAAVARVAKTETPATERVPAKAATTAEEPAAGPNVKSETPTAKKVKASEQLKDLELESVNKPYTAKEGSGYKNEFVKTREALNSKINKWSAKDRDNAFDFLEGLTGPAAARRDNYFAALANSDVATVGETVARLRQAESSLAGHSTVVESLEIKISAKTKEIIAAKRAKDKAGAIALARQRSALELEKTLIEFRDQLRVKNIFDSNGHNSFLAKIKKYNPHSTDNTFSVDVEVTGNRLSLCRGSYATENAVSGISGGFLTLCKPGSYHTREETIVLGATPFDSTLPESEFGYSRFNRFEVDPPARFSLGQNRDVAYNKPGEVIDGTGGAGGGIEVFCSRTKDCPGLNDLKASVRVPSCERSASVACNKIFDIQESVRGGNVATKSDQLGFLKKEEAAVDRIIAAQKVNVDRYYDLFTRESDSAALIRFRKEHPDLVSALNLKREIELKQELVSAGNINALDSETARIVELENSIPKVEAKLKEALSGLSNDPVKRVEAARKVLLDEIGNAEIVKDYRIGSRSADRELASLNVYPPKDDLDRIRRLYNLNASAARNNDVLLQVKKLEERISGQINGIEGLTDAQKTALREEAFKKIRGG